MYSSFGWYQLGLSIPTKPEWEAFKRDEALVRLKHYALMRNKYGIWASNQDRYVQDVAELNQMDDTWAEQYFNANDHHVMDMGIIIKDRGRCRGASGELGI